MKEGEKLFREAGAILEGHFLLTSGLHSPIYLEKFQVLQYPRLTERLCAMIARHYEGRGIQVVAGPTVGGVILAFEVGKQLGVRSIFAERENEGGGGISKKEEQKRVFRRGFTLAPGERVLVVDDVLTTGGSLREVLAAVKRHGGEVVGVGVLVDRAEGKVDLGVPLFSCWRLSIPTYAPGSCPLCAQGLPLVKPGSSRSAEASG